MMELGKKVSFGFSSVVAGQKSAVVNAEPQLIVNSTPGKFTITAPVSKAMGIAVGENIQFVNNISELEAAIVDGNEELKAIAEELNVDITTREGAVAVIDACTQLGIIKGQAIFDSKGQPVMVAPGFKKFVEDHADEILESNRDELIARAGKEDATDEELLATVKPADLDYPEVQSYTGSKTATTSQATGVGCQLGFTDSSVWNTLKKDLGDAAKTKNRIFKVLLDTPVKANVDGKEIAVYMLEFEKDVDPIVRGK